ncbi:hypothetical protein A2U01_0111964, partial [Trifolium medium]|nr:hypothetical protein [Trifolium medium]
MTLERRQTQTILQLRSTRANVSFKDGCVFDKEKRAFTSEECL